MDYNIYVIMKLGRFYILTNKTAMENKIQKLENLQIKAKGLWISYMKTNDVFKSSILLKKWNNTMDKILKLEQEISKLLFDDLHAND